MFDDDGPKEHYEKIVLLKPNKHLKQAAAIIKEFCGKSPRSWEEVQSYLKEIKDVYPKEYENILDQMLHNMR